MINSKGAKKTHNGEEKVQKDKKRIQAKTPKPKHKVILNLGFIWKTIIGDCDFYNMLVFSI